MNRTRAGMRPSGPRALRRLVLLGAWLLGLSVMGAQAQGNSPTVSVAITSPAPGAVIPAPGAVALGATASINRNNWQILEVGFYAGGTLVGRATSAPWVFTWPDVPAGTYSVTAQAIASNPGQAKKDSPGPTWSAGSAPVTFRVNAPPAVSLTAPAAGAVFNPPGAIQLTANAADSDGTIAKVAFYQGATLIGTVMSAPYSVTWANPAPGSYSLTARATDSDGAVTTSTALSIRVNAPPTVSLSAPAPGTVVNAGASISMTAAAADTDGAVSKVDFYAGTTLIGTAASAPYSVTWANPAPGTYSLTARATDSDGAVTSSPAVSLRMNASPTVSLTAPAAATVVNAGANITVTATAADTDGTVAKVEFYQGAMLLGTATSAPYSVTWANPAPGSYTLTARATDSDGAVTSSSALSIRVNTPPTVTITIPSAGAVVSAGSSLTVTATAADSDGSLARVDFYQGAELVGTATAAPYSFTLTKLAAGTHNLRAVATDNDGAATISSVVSIRANAPPTVSITGPAGGASFTAPASITLTATAADVDGTITRVEFWQGTTLLATASNAPYTYAWGNVPAGSYSLTARARDNDGVVVSSAAVNVTVTSGVAQMYFIQVDHLNTPRLIADAAGTTVWRWDQEEPFGSIAPNDNPAGTGAFDFPLRFPGQYFDRETNLAYNYFRDYDPSIGRYIQSDPIGLAGGLNMYLSVEGDPIGSVDPLGLWVKRCSRLLGSPSRSTTDRANLFRHDYLNVSGTTLSFGPTGSMLWSQGEILRNSEDPNRRCGLVCNDDAFDAYVLKAADEIGAPTYCIHADSASLLSVLGARNCQSWVDNVLALARKKYLANIKCPKCFR